MSWPSIRPKTYDGPRRKYEPVLELMDRLLADYEQIGYENPADHVIKVDICGLEAATQIAKTTPTWPGIPTSVGPAPSNGEGSDVAAAIIQAYRGH